MSASCSRVAIERFRFQVATAFLLPLIVLGLGAPQVPPQGTPPDPPPPTWPGVTPGQPVGPERPGSPPPGRPGIPSGEGECPLCKGTREVVCPHCHGDWRNVKELVPCKRERGEGCDQSGAVACKECGGKGEKVCEKCGGAGYVVYRSSTGRTPKFSERVVCVACGGKGKVDCEHCERGLQCPKCKRYFKPGRDTPKYCKWCYPDTESMSEKEKQKLHPLEYVDGVCVCPRCKGKGEYVKTGPCPKCQQGKVPCPLCGKSKKP